MSSKRTAWLIGGTATILIVLLGWRSMRVLDADRPPAPKAKTFPVDAATARLQPMPLTVTAVGTVESEHSVRIRPQISGLLQQVFFTEGDTVTKGQRLFLIDPAPYRAALASAKAAWENAKAQLARIKSLIPKHYASPQEYDAALASADQTEAAYQQAQINLSYTDIRAPISGRTGSLAVKSGNLVSTSDTTPLVTINQMKPILVQFNLPQRLLDDIRHYQSAGQVKVFITHEDGTNTLDTGRLVFIDNGVNTDTGTVMLKAEAPNAHEQLWPGQFVGVRTQLTVQPQALVIPDSALQSGQDSDFVYKIVGGKAVYQPVTVDRQVDQLAVISKGLQPGERLITHVPRNLRDGSPVTVTVAANGSGPGKP